MINSELIRHDEKNCSQEQKKGKKPAHFDSLIYRKFLDWSLSSTIHGYPNIFKSKQTLYKILWVVFMLASIMGCVLLINGCVNDYLDYRVVTKLRVVKEDIADFPTVTVCNSNPFTTETASNILNEIKMDNFSNDLWNANYFKTKGKKSPYFELLYRASQPEYGDSKRKALGYSLKEILIYCSLNKIDCSDLDFEWYYSFMSGNCFRFNSGTNAQGHKISYRNSTFSGQESALNLFFYLPPSSSTKFPLYSTGLTIFINNSTFLPIKLSDGIDVELGKMTNIELKRTLTYKSPFPYSDCVNLESAPTELYKYILSLKRNYRQKDCFELCFQKEIVRECKCYALKYPKYGDAEYCRNSTQYDCFVGVYRRLKLVASQCSQECPLECDSVAYDYTISSATLSQVYYEFLISHMEKESSTIMYEQFRQRAVGVRIYYPRMHYTEITESPKFSIFDVLSSLGGSLGLCLGMSILSFIDIAFILFEMFILVICKRKRSRI